MAKDKIIRAADSNRLYSRIIYKISAKKIYNIMLIVSNPNAKRAVAICYKLYVFSFEKV